MEIICMGPEIWTKCMDPKKDIIVDGKICCTNSKRAMVVG